MYKELGVNIEKLKARFPEKFSVEKANHRNLDREREILEAADKNKEIEVGSSMNKED